MMTSSQKEPEGEGLGSERPTWTDLRSPKVMADSLTVSPGDQASRSKTPSP